MGNDPVFEIIIWAVLLIISIIAVLFFVFPNHVKEGNSGMDVILGKSDPNDPCDYNLHVPGMIKHISAPSARIDIRELGIHFDALEPIKPVINVINNIIDVINDTIIFGHYIAFDFVNCLLFYLLDAIGLIIYGIILGFFKLIGMGNIPNMIYSFFDKIDSNLYNMTGQHFMHFPTKIQNKCYHIFGKNRIKCWQNPYASKEDKQEGIGVVNDDAQNTAFYNFLITTIFIILTVCFIYVLAIYLAQFFSVKPVCPSGACS